MKKTISVFLSTLLLIAMHTPGMAKEPVHIEAKSGSATTAVLELYTSEGCQNCPAAEKYLKQMVDKYQGEKQFVPLAFHVDYWDYIGWEDPFSQPEFGARQRDIAIRNKLNSLYTPQFVLHGQDFPAYENIPEAIGIINQIKPQANIQLTATLSDLQLDTRITIEAANERSKHDANVFIAIAENNLSSNITEGENQGLALQHAYVVRQLVGPFSLDGKDKLDLNQTIQLDKAWKLGDLSLVVFVQDKQDGTTHQAIKASLSSLKQNKE